MKKILKWIAIIFVGIVILSALFGGKNDKVANVVDDKTKIEQKSQPALSIISVEQQKQAISEFNQKITTNENLANASIEKFTSVSQKGNINDTYEEAKNAITICKNVNHNLNTLDIAKNLPKDIEELLKKAKENYGTAYYCKVEALEDALEYMDNPKPSIMQKVKEQNGSFNSFISEGNANMAEINKKIGI